MAGPGAELRYEEAPRQAMQRLWTPFDGNLMPPDSWAGFSCELYDDDTRYPGAPWASEDGDPATDEEIENVFVSTGTTPAGSTWATNPIPR